MNLKKLIKKLNNNQLFEIIEAIRMGLADEEVFFLIKNNFNSQKMHDIRYQIRYNPNRNERSFRNIFKKMFKRS